MKHNFFYILSLVLLCASHLQAVGSDSLMMKSGKEKKILVNNRILAVANGKPISTYDLMKKMDLSFFRQFPEYSSSTEARFQFYEVNWRQALDDVIDKQLILADAKESKVEVTAGDVRQDIETAFGPNIIENLDKAGFTYEETFKIMQEEILIRRLVSGRVHSKAIHKVTPNRVRQAYEDYRRDPANTRQTEWVYRTVTIKERNLEKSEQTAKIAYQMLMDGVPLDQLEGKLKEKNVVGRVGKVTLSNVIKQGENEVSDDYRNHLLPLDKGMYSQPFSHKSRVTKAVVFRILAVEEKVPGGVAPYKEMESKLKDILLDREVENETDQYLSRLRQHYHIREKDIEDHLPPNYQPFSLN